MKRQSKAEEALNKQIRMLQDKQDNLRKTREAIENQMLGVSFILQQLLDEVQVMKNVRIAASERLSKG